MFFILKKACEKLGLTYPVKWVKSADHVLSYLLREAPFEDPAEFPMPGVILMDVRMPGRPTAEVLAEIKGNEKLRSIPVILWSNYTQEMLQELSNSGMDGFITKPSGFKELMEIIPQITAKMQIQD